MFLPLSQDHFQKFTVNYTNTNVDTIITNQSLGYNNSKI